METVYPAVFRTVGLNGFQHERISTPDKDFLDLRWLRQGSEKVVILSHGLEGNCERAYIKGMARAFFMNGFDALTWNYRGCGEEMNWQLRFYHSGATDDLDCVTGHAISAGYKHIYLIDFSLGGNLVMKYAGEDEVKGKREVRGAVAFSVPLNLDTSCMRISQPENRLYALRFLFSLKKKVIAKSKVMKGIDISGIGKIDNLRAFDDRYTAPLHGFRDAVTYYRECSSLHFLEKVRLPALIVNAQNDPFLAEDCYPHPDNPLVHVDYPEKGGHVGFTLFNRNGLYWSELRALQFITSL